MVRESSRFFKKASPIFIGLILVILGLFFFKKKANDYHCEVPLHLDKFSLPCINVSIENTLYPLIIDSGSRLELKLYEKTLAPIPKKPYRKEKWRNFRGTLFEASTYLISKMAIGSLVFKKSEAVAFPSHRSDESTIWGESSSEDPYKSVGSLGQGLLRKVAILIDVKNQKIIFSNNLYKLKKSGYNFNNFIKAPLEITPTGTFVHALTDIGKLKLFIDTGSTWTVLHEHLHPKNIKKDIRYHGLPVLISSKFSMHDTDFGKQELLFLNMSDKVIVHDGILGMDFFKKHVVYIDFPNKTMYIKKPA